MNFSSPVSQDSKIFLGGGGGGGGRGGGGEEKEVSPRLPLNWPLRSLKSA